MNVRLIWITPNAEKLILYMARVSNPKNQNSENTRLINYLTEHGHWSPLDMVDMCVEVTTSRAMSAQAIRHRSAYFQEFSQRYAEVQEIEPIEIRRRAAKNRQSSEEVFNPTLSNGRTAQEQVKFAVDTCLETYNLLLEAEAGTECARMILPIAAQTRYYMKNTVRNWIFYIALRTKEDTQKEHRLIAEAIKEIFVLEFPVVSEALGWRV